MSSVIAHDIRYRIFNTSIAGTIKRQPGMTYRDLSLAIQKIHNLYNDKIIYLHNENANSIIPDDKNVVLLKSKNVQKCIRICNNALAIPDSKRYELGILRLTKFIREGKLSSSIWKGVKRTKEIQVVKIIVRQPDNKIVIKLQKRTTINWGGCGPTLPSLYAFIDTKNHTLNPIWIVTPDFERLLQKKCMQYVAQYPNINEKWESVELPECSVCMDKKSNTFTYCKCQGVSVCSDCVNNLDKCPICRETIYTHDPVTIL